MIGDLVQYDFQNLVGTEACRAIFGDESIFEGDIRWEDMIMYYETLPIILAGLIGGFICPNRRSQGFIIGWGDII